MHNRYKNIHKFNTFHTKIFLFFGMLIQSPLFFSNMIFAQQISPENAKKNIQKNLKKDIKKILKNAPSELQVFYKNSKKYRFQVIYTPITRLANNTPILGKTQKFGVKKMEYFYPASVVKLPIVLCALEKLNLLSNKNIDTQTPIIFEANRPPQTESKNDTTAKNGLASIGHYIEKIFVTSDNDASNRLYEFLGQQHLNENMHKKGYKSFCVTHRLAAPQYNIGDNRYTNAMAFFEPKNANQSTEKLLKNPTEIDTENAQILKQNAENNTSISAKEVAEMQNKEKSAEKSSKKLIAKTSEITNTPNNFLSNILYTQTEVYNQKNFFHKAKNSFVGKSYINGENLVKTPLSFKQRNFFALEDMQNVLKSVFFPEFSPKKSLFNIKKEDISLLKNAMKMLPRQSNITSYQNLPDSYAKYLYKTLKNNEKIPEHVQIYNKVGMAFGFLVENAYIINEKTKQECLLSVSMYVNEDEIMNDDKYEYDTLGFPLLEYLRKNLLGE